MTIFSEKNYLKTLAALMIIFGLAFALSARAEEATSTPDELTQTSENESTQSTSTPEFSANPNPTVDNATSSPEVASSTTESATSTSYGTESIGQATSTDINMSVVAGTPRVHVSLRALLDNPPSGITLTTLFTDSGYIMNWEGFDVPAGGKYNVFYVNTATNVRGEAFTHVPDGFQITWTIPANLPEGNYKVGADYVVAGSVVATGYTDVFPIRKWTEISLVTNKGAYQASETIELRLDQWTATDPTNYLVDLYISPTKDGGKVLLHRGLSIPAEGRTMSFRIADYPDFNQGTGQYGFLICATADSLNCSVGADNTNSHGFTITGSNPISYTVAVVAPAAGATWLKGQNNTVLWTINSIPTTTAKISLDLISSTTDTVVASIGQDTDKLHTSFGWTIPSNLASGAYRVKVSYLDSANAVLASGSSSVFNIGTTSVDPDWFAIYYDYTEAHPDMNISLPYVPYDRVTYGPLDSRFGRDWYDDQYRVATGNIEGLNHPENFFPLDYRGQDPAGSGHNYFFGIHFKAYATVSATGTYSYFLRSDDDTFLYVDKVLKENNSGLDPAHPSRVGSIYMVPGERYILDLFFAERHVPFSAIEFYFTTAGVEITPCNTDCDPIAGTNHNPIISIAGPSPVYVNEANQWRFDVSDPDNDLLSVFITWGDGASTTLSGVSSGTQLPSNHTYSNTGDYTITAVVTDPTGRTATATKLVEVTNRGSGGSCTSNCGGGGGGGGGSTLPTVYPIIIYSTHQVNVPSYAKTVVVGWKPSVTNYPGTVKYSYAWSREPDTNPDSIPETELLTAFANLGNGRWYFHLVSIDPQSRVSSTVHYGPILITDPVSTDGPIAYKSKPIVKPQATSTTIAAVDCPVYAVATSTGTTTRGFLMVAAAGLLGFLKGAWWWIIILLLLALLIWNILRDKDDDDDNDQTVVVENK